MQADQTEHVRFTAYDGCRRHRLTCGPVSLPEENVAGQGSQKGLALTGLGQQADLLGSSLASYQQVDMLVCNIVLQRLRQLQHLNADIG